MISFVIKKRGFKNDCWRWLGVFGGSRVDPSRAVPGLRHCARASVSTMQRSEWIH